LRLNLNLVDPVAIATKEVSTYLIPLVNLVVNVFGF